MKIFYASMQRSSEPNITKNTKILHASMKRSFEPNITKNTKMLYASMERSSETPILIYNTEHSSMIVQKIHESI